jgi:glucose-1-phosphate thymidylyltransferase
MSVRAGAASKRFVCMHSRGVIVVHPTTRSRGPWLDATHAPSLQRIANRPIVCHVLDAFAAAGVAQTAVLTPPDLLHDIAKCIEQEGPPRGEVSYLAHDSHADPGGALQAIAKFAGEAPVIVHRSDGLLGQPLGPFLELLEGDAPDIVLLLAQGARNVERLGPATQRMLRVAEFDPANAALGMAGVCMLGPGALSHLACSEAGAEAAAAAHPGLDLGALVESLVARGSGRVLVRVVREWRAFGGDALDLLDMNRVVLEGLDYQVPSCQRDGNRFEGRVVIDPTASVTSSVICGPVIVGAGAHVSDSYIGPHTSIGAGVHVEGAEIERSIVFAGASIIHVGGRLVASVVGREAKVFRDFSVPRAMRLQVGDGDEVALC